VIDLVRPEPRCPSNRLAIIAANTFAWAPPRDHGLSLPLEGADPVHVSGDLKSSEI